MKSMKSAAQAGFTLIELIVVIVILGILAATALPKFVSFGTDARAASVNAVKGALSSASSMAKGKFVVAGGTTTSVEGNTVTFVTGNGYPVADTGFTAAAGFPTGQTDYLVLGGTTASTATSTQPGAVVGQLVFVPSSVAGTAASLNCYASYTQPAASSTAAPVITTVVSSC